MAGILISGRGGFLIAGYNTMNKQEQAKYDEKALCRIVGWFLILISFFLMFIPVGIYFEILWLPFCGTILIIATLVGFIIYANTGKSFRRTDITEFSTDENSVKISKKNGYIFTTIFFTVVLIFIIGIFIYGTQEPVINVFENSIQIKAMYGLNIDFSEITDIILLSDNMKSIGAGKRVNGYGGFGETLKGYFSSDEFGEIILFVKSNSSPTIKIECVTGKQDIFISFHNGSQTKELYDKMVYAFYIK
jgi:hypothetical protein